MYSNSLKKRSDEVLGFLEGSVCVEDGLGELYHSTCVQLFNSLLFSIRENVEIHGRRNALHAKDGGKRSFAHNVLPDASRSETTVSIYSERFPRSG